MLLTKAPPTRLNRPWFDRLPPPGTTRLVGNGAVDLVARECAVFADPPVFGGEAIGGANDGFAGVVGERVAVEEDAVGVGVGCVQAPRPGSR